MKGESLWITSVDDHEPSKPVLDFIKEQASYLSEETGGKVKAVLAPAGTSWRSIISSLSLFSEDSYHPTHHSNANDASSLYKKRTYEFYIVDEKHNYELSVFQITSNDTLPASLAIEPTIASEAGFETNITDIQVNSLKEFISMFEEIIRSNKVMYIIDRLIKMHSYDHQNVEENQ